MAHSGPERFSKKINSSEVWYIFLKTKLYDNSKKCFLKIFALHPSPLDTCIFWKKHPREKCQKVDPNYFSILDGVYFLYFFPKTTFSASKLQFLFKKSTFVGFRGEIEVWDTYSGFCKKVKKVDPPKLVILGGVLLSSLLAKNPSKCLKTAILPQKTTKVDFLKRNCNLEAFRVFFGKKWRK